MWGGILWVVGMLAGGFIFGSVIPDVDRYLLPVIGLIIVISVLPTALHIYKENRQEINGFIRSRLGRPAKAS